MHKTRRSRQSNTNHTPQSTVKYKSRAAADISPHITHNKATTLLARFVPKPTKKEQPDDCSFFLYRRLIQSGTLDLTGLQAGSTYMQSGESTVDDRLDSANVRLPHLVGSSMGMADHVTKVHALLTDITFCHFEHLLH